MTVPTKSLNLVTHTVVDTAEEEIGFTAAGQVKPALGLALVAGVGGGVVEPYLSFSETPEETEAGFDLADQIVVAGLPAGKIPVHVTGGPGPQDIGTGAAGEEALDFVDYGIAVNGAVVMTSEEGPQDAANTNTFTFDGVIQIENGDQINLVAISSGKGETFEVENEAAEGAIVFSPN